MKTNSTQQEILLMTGTSFSARQWCEKKTDDKNNLSEKEQLEEVCWNGLLYDMLPEINLNEENKKLFLWEIKEGKSFIDIEIGEAPVELSKEFSIDPYSFMHFQIFS